MRSYDWRMPEEKYRTIADHLSDRIYAYTPEYKSQGVAEGIPDQNIIVTGNPIVDVLEEYFLSGKLRMTDSDFVDLLENKYKIQSKDFLVMTCHRRENVEDFKSLSTILELAKQTKHPVLFPAGYRTQKMLQEFDLTLPSNIVMVDPVGYLELLELMVASKGILTDSGTVVEEASVLGVPTIQMRKSTERPEVYISKSSVKFDPSDAPDLETTLKLFFALEKNGWTHLFRVGKASYRIVDDLVLLFNQQNFRGHQPEKYEPFSKRSFMN